MLRIYIFLKKQIHLVNISSRILLHYVRVNSVRMRLLVGEEGMDLYSRLSALDRLLIAHYGPLKNLRNYWQWKCNFGRESHSFGSIPFDLLQLSSVKEVAVCNWRKVLKVRISLIGGSGSPN